jgi:uncharacterized membrane protein YdfJ with MMPL/SSD domain
VRLLALAVALLVSLPLCAQEKEKAGKKKKAAPPPKAVHQQASKEQIRKFNDLQKKQKDAK